MSADLTLVTYCPDCGGVVGATKTTENGPPCRCFADRPQPAPLDLAPADDIDDREASTGPLELRTPSSDADGGRATESAESPAGESPDAAPAEKVCVLCGKDVAGHRRLKDSRGYICLDCAKLEKTRGKPQGVKCPKCFRVVKPETLTERDGVRICQRCLREARELARPGSKRFRKIDDSHFEESNKKQIVVLAVVAGVLALIIIIGLLKTLLR